MVTIYGIIGVPNGYGLHVAYSKMRIVTVFQISHKDIKLYVETELELKNNGPSQDS